MSEYTCLKCNKSFKQKGHLEHHETKNACKEYSHHCKLCDKGFTTASSMYRHIRNNCQVKKKDDVEKNGIYERLVALENNNLHMIETNRRQSKTEKKMNDLEDDNKKLKNEIKLLREGSNVFTHNVFNVNTGTINHIHLVGYGNEDISRLDKNTMLKILQHGYNSTLKLTEAIHFNPKYPEYHNVYITNMKDKYAMMFDGENWTLTIKDDLINKIYDDKKNYIEENLDDFIESLSMSRKKALERWLATDDDDKKIKEIKENIKLMLYNSKHIPIDAYRQKDSAITVGSTARRSNRSIKAIKYIT
jgi:hypothetical protein